jgi:hypothetical protein
MFMFLFSYLMMGRSVMLLLMLIFSVLMGSLFQLMFMFLFSYLIMGSLVMLLLVFPFSGFSFFLRPWNWCRCFFNMASFT